MSSRNTDTGKWDKAWFRKLPPRLKCAWMYLCDKCSFVGIWEIDIDMLCFYVGEPISLDELLSTFDLTAHGDDKLFIPGFVPFQYYGDYGGLDPNPKNFFHAKIMRQMDALGLPYKIVERPAKGSPKGIQPPIDTPPQGGTTAPAGAKGKERIKKGKGKGKERDPDQFDFESAFKNYPRKPEGKSLGLKRCREQIKTPEAFQEFITAVSRYAEDCRKANREKHHIKLFSSFLGTKDPHPWRDWIGEPEDSPATSAAYPPGLSPLDVEAGRKSAAERDAIPPADPTQLARVRQLVAKVTGKRE